MSESVAIQWVTEKRKVNDLVPFEHNPRILDKSQAERLQRSIEKFNLAEIPAINANNMIIAGHQRVAILKLLGRGEEEIDVRVPNRQLTKDELQEYNLISNKVTGEWDWDILLNNFDKDLLKGVGFTDDQIMGFGSSDDAGEGGTAGSKDEIICGNCDAKLRPDGSVIST